MRRRALTALAIGSGLALALGAFSNEPPAPPAIANASATAAPPPSPGSGDPSQDPAACESRPLKLPSGGAAVLSCVEARRIVAQVKSKLATPVASPAALELAQHTAGWLDPHGLWSAAPDSPIKAALTKYAARLLAELEAAPNAESRCEAAEEIGRVARDWAVEIRRELEAARRSAPRLGAERTRLLAEQSVFQDDPVTRPARLLARDLGARIGSFEAEFGDAAGAVPAALARLAPEQSLESWTKAVLAAAIRAYVPAVDPHGQWVPLDEEWSLYSADPALDAEPRLWGRMVRTALGVRVSDEATPPLSDGDLVLAVGGVATAGLSVEQVEQLAHLESIGGESTRDVVVLRRGERAPRTLSVELEQDAEGAAPGLSVRRVGFGSRQVAVVSVPDVPDELGEDLERVVLELGEERDSVAGVVLDLRGNGGGSIDGAARAIGVFLPGAPIFPLKRRDGAIELQHATAPADAHVWRGPVAALVDGYTASAAEMIAGALLAYRRGPVLGSRTFGKGCVQEYFDDPAGAGVVRLTTMLFALPDGSPLQGVGLSPSLSVALPRVAERERSIAGSMPPWQGPDIRARAAMGGPDWPAHRGVIGVSDDPSLRAALARLGAAAPPRRSAAVLGGRAARRAGPE
ncbi:MAG: hypothetical protein IPM35_13585 [Myxococcales bacterium]|nr:hypothetical protein [Myxococcales bacterium]